MGTDKKELISAVEDDLLKTKILLMSRVDTVFFTTIVFSLIQKISTQVATAAVDGKTIYINPDFFNGLNKDEKLFILLHEAMHIAYLHIARKGSKNHFKWNIACDYVINLMLQKAGFTVPEGAYIDKKYGGMSAEEVYDKLPDNISNSDKFQLSDLTEGTEPANDEELSREIEDIIVSAYRAEMDRVNNNIQAGNIPADLKRFAENLLNPKLPWNHILRKFVNRASKDDYSWRRPNKRLLQTCYLPSLHSETIGNIMLVIDTSGSILDNEINTFISESLSIIKSTKPKDITLVSFDTRVNVNQKITKITDLTNINLSGGGGTDVNPVIQLSHQTKPKLVICFTDGHFDKLKLTPLKNTYWIWVIKDNPNFKVPFGKAIYYKE